MATAGVAGALAALDVSQAQEESPFGFAPGKAEHCIMIWLGGGACHIDTWDPKRQGDPATRKPGSDYAAIDTAVDGTQVCEHLEKCASVLDRMNIVRTTYHELIDEHAIATNMMHTGRHVSGTVTYPSIGSLMTYHKGAVNESAPPYVLIGYPTVSRNAGFLGSKHGFVYLTDTREGPSGLARPATITNQRQKRREDALKALRDSFLNKQPSKVIQQYDGAIGQALKLASPDFMSAFKLENEPDALREQYGGEFGQRCLLSRRLVERGVRFIEVSHNLNFVNGTGWDTHNAGQDAQHLLIRELDSALSSLVMDLESKKLLDKTLICVATEFGRPAAFDGGGGRGHHSKCFSTVLAGGGLQNGRTIGVTDELGMKTLEQPVSVPDLHASMHFALGINPRKLVFDDDRPIPTTDMGTPVRDLFV